MILVEFIEQGDPGGDVQARDVLVGDVVQVLDQRAQRVAVCGDQDGVTGGQVRDDGFLPVRQHACHDVLEALGAGTLVCGNVGVARIVELRVLRVGVLHRRRGVVAATPQHELFVTVLVAGGGLVQSLQRTVVALVQTPAAAHRNPVAIATVEGKIGGVDGAAQQRGVEHRRQQPLRGQQLCCFPGLGLALLVDVDVHPPGEQILRVPFALAVAEQDQLSGHGVSLQGRRPPAYGSPHRKPSGLRQSLQICSPLPCRR